MKRRGDGAMGRRGEGKSEQAMMRFFFRPVAASPCRPIAPLMSFTRPQQIGALILLALLLVLILIRSC
jgi:hypothetical protein